MSWLTVRSPAPKAPRILSTPVADSAPLVLENSAALGSVLRNHRVKPLIIDHWSDYTLYMAKSHSIAVPRKTVQVSDRKMESHSAEKLNNEPATSPFEPDRSDAQSVHRDRPL